MEIQRTKERKGESSDSHVIILICLIFLFHDENHKPLPCTSLYHGSHKTIFILIVDSPFGTIAL